jgi:hypothetical protein
MRLSLLEKNPVLQTPAFGRWLLSFPLPFDLSALCDSALQQFQNCSAPEPPLSRGIFLNPRRDGEVFVRGAVENARLCGRTACN